MLYVKGFLVALQGVPVTVGVTLIAMVTGVVLGLVLALMKMSRIKVLTALASLYIEIIRGTPLIVQALIMAYGLPQLLQSSGISFRWPYLIIPAVIVCGLNSAAYVAGGHPQRYSGGGQGTDGSGPLPRIELRRYDEKNHFASGGQEHPAGFGQ